MLDPDSPYRIIDLKGGMKKRIHHQAFDFATVPLAKTPIIGQVLLV